MTNYRSYDEYKLATPEDDYIEERDYGEGDNFEEYREKMREKLNEENK